jgi:hypothetical protein
VAVTEAFKSLLPLLSEQLKPVPAAAVREGPPAAAPGN